MFNAIVRTMFMFVQLLKKEKLILNMTEADDIPVLSNKMVTWLSRKKDY